MQRLWPGSRKGICGNPVAGGAGTTGSTARAACEELLQGMVMRKALRDRLLDRSSLAMSSRQLKVVALAGVLGVAGATGVALRGEEMLSGPTGLVPATAAGVPVNAAPKGTPLLRVASLEVVDPAQAGLDPARLDDAVGAVRREVARG